MVSVVKNACCWFGIKFYVICEMGLVNYSNLLFFALFLHPLFLGGVGWRGLYYLFICKKNDSAIVMFSSFSLQLLL